MGKAVFLFSEMRNRAVKKPTHQTDRRSSPLAPKFFNVDKRNKFTNLKFWGSNFGKSSTLFCFDRQLQVSQEAQNTRTFKRDEVTFHFKIIS
jgi:hypothetical protein